MKPTGLAIIAMVFIISGCALKVVPQSVQNGVVNSKDQSLTIEKNGISISVLNNDSELYSYNLEGAVTAFTVTINNQSSNEVAFDNDSFLLIDNNGQQYYPLTPEKLKEMISRDSYYLIPYPYVGFYYLEDYEKSSFYTKSSSQIPYYYEVYPQDIYTKALPSGAIIPNAKITGFVYFKIDLHGKKSVKLLVYKNGTSKSSSPDFTFPFQIE